MLAAANTGTQLMREFGNPMVLLAPKLHDGWVPTVAAVSGQRSGGQRLACAVRHCTSAIDRV
jgi:hypothetical protein